MSRDKIKKKKRERTNQENDIKTTIKRMSTIFDIKIK
jgi:hypothetical protein